MSSIRFLSEKDIGKHCRIRQSVPLSVNLDCGLKKAQDTHKGAGKPKIERKAREKRKESVWQRRLFDRLVSEGLNPVWELKKVIPGRNFSVDIAFPDVKCAIEVDGWQHHGKTLSAFKSDRKRQNLFVEHGWRVLRFFPGEISSDMDAIVATISRVIENPTP